MTDGQNTPQTTGSDDTEFLAGLERVLGQWRSDILASVTTMIDAKIQMPATDKATEKPTEGKGVSATKALQQQLDELRTQLKSEKLNKQVSELAGANKMHSDLLEMVIKAKFGQIDEVDGKFYLKADGGDYKPLDAFVSEYAKTPEGQRLMVVERQTTPLGLGGRQSVGGQVPMSANGKIDVAQMLMDAI